MNKKIIIVKALFATFAVGAILSCSKSEDAFDPTALDQRQKEVYSNNFVEKYGADALNNTWDFTTGARLATRAATGISVELLEEGLDFGEITRRSVSSWKEVTGVTKNTSLFNGVKNVLPEQTRHTGVSASVLVAPASEFYIFPFFSGGCLRFDLKVKVGDSEPVTIFQKGWYQFQSINGMELLSDKIMANAAGQKVNMGGVKIQAPVGTPVEVYLDNIYDDDYKCSAPNAGTANGQAIYVDLPEGTTIDLPEGIDLHEDAIIKCIGIEDINVKTPGRRTCDYDYNDVLVAVVGNPDVPQEVIIENGSYTVNTSITKRYMMEDLGATDDFDFNDVVVDVIQNMATTHTTTIENGIIVDDVASEPEVTSQKAIVRCMGGTLDFTLTVGDISWTKSDDFDASKMYNTQGDVKYEAELKVLDVTGWNPSENNVSVLVKSDTSGQVLSITFPKTGTAPMMIAVDPERNWMKERVSVPEDWWYPVN